VALAFVARQEEDHPEGLRDQSLENGRDDTTAAAAACSGHGSQ
jgi:hypothetical protein